MFIGRVEFKVDGQPTTCTMEFPPGGRPPSLVARTLLDKLGVEVLVTLRKKGVDIMLLSNHVLHVRQQGEHPVVIRAQTAKELEEETQRICATPYWVPVPPGPCPHVASLVAKADESAAKTDEATGQPERQRDASADKATSQPGRKRVKLAKDERVATVASAARKDAVALPSLAQVQQLLVKELRWRSGQWAPFQLSTYELLCKVERLYRGGRTVWPSSCDWIRWTAELDNELRCNSAVYGAYVGLDQWSPRYTLQQLWRVARLIHAVYSARLAAAFVAAASAEAAAKAEAESEAARLAAAAKAEAARFAAAEPGL